jgi:hypothetical protein
MAAIQGLTIPEYRTTMYRLSAAIMAQAEVDFLLFHMRIHLILDRSITI